MSRLDRSFTCFLRILNRLDGEGLFRSSKDIAEVVRVFRQAATVQELEGLLTKSKQELLSALSHCEKKKRYKDKEKAYRAAQNKHTVYWCKHHDCWHLSTMKRK